MSMDQINKIVTNKTEDLLRNANCCILKIYDN
jgi:hypothetical protein